MIDPKNLVNIAGGIVADPQVVNENIVKLRVAVDFAGSEKGSDNNSGYFDVTYYTNSGDRNAEFVMRQVKEGKLKKGSRIHVLGRLVQERWTNDDGKNNSKVVVVAEGLTYQSGGGSGTTGVSSGSVPTSTSSSVPSDF